VTVTINADDPRTIRALELAAEADHWLSGHNAEGQEVFGMPSQSEPGRYYIVTESSCDCPDFRHAEEPRACKHILAVRLHTELVRAQRGRQPERRRGHLSLISTR
jgi:hypothetical protein